MRITMRWVGQSGKSGRVPGKWGTVFDAEEAAKVVFAKYPRVVKVFIYHETSGLVKELGR